MQIISNINSENKELLHQIKTYKKLLNFNDESMEIVSILENDKNSLFIIQNSNNILSDPVIKLEYEAIYSDYQSGEILLCLYIIDFLTKRQCDENHGYGTKLMTAFINYAKKKNIPAIKGWLSPIDLDKSDNINRLYHFYNKKFGFSIDENKRIYLQIK